MLLCMHVCVSNVQVVGVGGGGGNAVNRMLANQLSGVEMYVMNTDAQVRQQEQGAWTLGDSCSCCTRQRLAPKPPCTARLTEQPLVPDKNTHTAGVLTVLADCPTSTCLNLLCTLTQALAASPLPPNRRVQIGSKLTRGLGAGGNPGVGLVSGEGRAAVGFC